MVTIEVGPVYSYLRGKYPHDKLRKVLSYRPMGYQYSDAFQCKVWDGYVYFLSPKGRLPGGLTPRVIKYFRKKKIKFKIVKKYDAIPFGNVGLIMKEFGLRPYQCEAVEAVFKYKRGVLNLPTGAGKTRIAAAIIKMINTSTVFIVPTIDLMYQTQKVFEELIGEKVGIIGDSKDVRCRIDVCSIKTIRNMKKFKKYLKTKKLIVVDEAHHAVADTWYKCIMETPAIYRIGLSATPEVHAAILLEACLGPTIIKIPPSRLIEEGFLSKPFIKMVQIDEPSGLQEKSYYTAYREGIENNDYRNKMMARLAKYCIDEGHYPVIILVKRIDHGEAVLEHLQNMKVKSVFVNGDHKSAERHIIIRRLSFNEKFVAVASDVFNEGVDAPGVKALISGGGGKSMRETLQKLGRGMRRDGKKKSVIVFDFIDAMNTYLFKHSKKRVNLYKKEGYPVEVFDLAKLKGGKESGKNRRKIYIAKKKLKRFRKTMDDEILYRDE